MFEIGKPTRGDIGCRHQISPQLSGYDGDARLSCSSRHSGAGGVFWLGDDIGRGKACHGVDCDQCGTYPNNRVLSDCGLFCGYDRPLRGIVSFSVPLPSRKKARTPDSGVSGQLGEPMRPQQPRSAIVQQSPTRNGWSLTVLSTKDSAASARGRNSAIVSGWEARNRRVAHLGDVGDVVGLP
jgi:hypothetical protein